MSGLSDEQLSRLDELGLRDELTDAEMAELQDLESLGQQQEEIDPNVAPSIKGFTVSDVTAGLEKQRDQAQLATIANAFRASQETTEDDAAATAAIAGQLKVPFDTVRANLPAFRKSASTANFDADRWRKENPELAKVLLQHPELGDAVLTSKELGPVVKAFNAASDWFRDTVRSRLGADSDAARASGALRKSMATGDAAPFKQEMAAQEMEGEQRKTERAKRDAPQQVLEFDDALAQIAKKKTGADYANMVAWQRGIETWKQLNLSKKYTELMIAENGGPGDVADLRKEISDLELEARPRAFGDNNGIVRDLSIGVQGAVSTMQVATGAVKGGGVAGAVGAVGGGLAGGVATRTPQGVVAGATAGARFLAPRGAQVGGAWATFQLEAGSQYKQSRDLVTDQGQKLTPGEAAGGAIVVGLINSGLEMLSFGQQTKALKGALPSQITGLIKKDPTFRRLLADLSREWFKSIATEGLTEGVQNAVGQVTEYAQAALKDQAPQRRPVLNLQEALADAEAGGLGAVLMGAGGTATSLALTKTADDKAQLDDRQVTPLLTLAQQPAVQAAPGVFAEMVKETSASNGGKPLASLHVDAQAIVRYFQNEGKSPEQIDAEVAELVGPQAPTQLLEAAHSGGKLEVPMDRVLGAWGKSEIGQALADDTSTDPIGLTTRQRAEQQAEIDARTQALVDQEVRAFEDAAHTDRLVEEYVQGIIEGGQDAKQARGAGVLLRTFMETAAADEGKLVSELFPEVPVSFRPGDEGGTANAPIAEDLTAPAEALPEAPPELSLEEIAAGLTKDQRADLLYRDDVTGLPTRRAWDATPRTPGTVVGVVTVPDVKGINDAPKGGHEVTNRLLRQVGTSLERLLPDRMVVRNGTDFLVEAQGQAELDALVARLQAAVPDKVRVLGFTGADVKEAYSNEKAGTTALRELPEGDPKRVLERGKTAFPVESLTDESFPGEPSKRPRVPLQPLEGEAFVHEALRDRQIPGVLSRHGFHLSPARPFSASIDLRGLKKINEWATKLAEKGELEGDPKIPGDDVLAAFSAAAVRAGGRRVFFAHMSGDEFAAKGVRGELEHFVQRFQAELQRIGIPVTLVDGTQFELVPKFRHGIAEGSYGKADQQLNTAKAAEPTLKPLDEAGELRRARILRRIAGRPDRQAGAVSADQGVDRGREGAAGVLREAPPGQPAEGRGAERGDEQVPGWVTDAELGPLEEAAPSDVTEEDRLVEALAAHHELRQEEEEAIRAGFNRPETIALAREAIARFRSATPALEAGKRESAERAERRKKAATKKRDERRAAALAFLKWIEGTGPRVAMKGDIYGGKDSVRLEPELYKQTVAWARKLNLIDPSNGMTAFWASQPKDLDPTMRRDNYTAARTPYERAVQSARRDEFVKNVLGRLTQADAQSLQAYIGVFRDEILSQIHEDTPELLARRQAEGVAGVLSESPTTRDEQIWMEARIALADANRVAGIMAKYRKVGESGLPTSAILSTQRDLLFAGRLLAESAAQSELAARAMLAGKTRDEALNQLWEEPGPDRLKLARSAPTFGPLLRDLEDRLQGLPGQRVLFQLPTEEESKRRLEEHLVLLDALREAGAKAVVLPAKWESVITTLEYNMRAAVRQGESNRSWTGTFNDWIQKTAERELRTTLSTEFGRFLPNTGRKLSGNTNAKKAGVTAEIREVLLQHAMRYAEAAWGKVGRQEVLLEGPKASDEMARRLAGEVQTGPAPVRSGGSRTHGAPLSDLTQLWDGGKPVAGGLYPADVYGPQGRRIYGDPGMEGDAETWRIIAATRGKPDAEVTVFTTREAEESREISPGDLVTLSRAHALARLDSERGEQIVSAKVRAGDLFADGNFMMEWGYDPEVPKGLAPVEEAQLNEINRSPTRLFQDDAGAARPGAPLWYSQVERAVEGARQAKNTGAAWWALLSKSPGVKQEELKLIGVEGFLRGRTGVTKEEVLKFARDNAVVLKEVVRQPVSPEAARDLEARVEGVSDPIERALRLVEENGWQLETDNQRRADLDTAVRALKDSLVALDAMSDHALEMISGNDSPEARESFNTSSRGIDALLMRAIGVFSAQQRDGEVEWLADGIGLAQTARRARHSLEAAAQDPGDRTTGTRFGFYILGGERAPLAVKASYRELTFEHPGAENWVNPHFTGPVVAHARTTERQLENGRTALMVEEVQSDLHQEGRKRGYRPDADPKKAEHDQIVREFEAPIRQALQEKGLTRRGPSDADVQAWLDEGDNAFLGLERDQGGWRAVATDGLPIGRQIYDTQAEAQAAAKEAGERQSLLSLEAVRRNWGLGALEKAMPERLHRANSTHKVTPHALFEVRGERVQLELSAGAGAWGMDLEAALEELLPEAKREQLRQALPAYLVATRAQDSDLERAESDLPPRAPWATTWEELVAKRMVTLALESGLTDLTWTTGAQQIERYEDGADTTAGMEAGMVAAYDKRLPSVLERILAPWGVKAGKTQLDSGEKVWHVDLSGASMDIVARGGMPLFQNEDGKGGDAAGAPKKKGGPKGYTIPGERALQGTVAAFLNRNADFSTVVHESAHGFLEQLLDLGERPDASARSRQKYNDALEALGVQTRAEITVKHHETFARNYEAWLAEGKMPSKKLQRMFRNFTTWLLRVYRSVRAIPGSDPATLERLRPVFEALHATEQQLAAARKAQGPASTAQTKEQREEELDDYAEESYDVQLRVVRDALRYREAWWKRGVTKLSAAIRDEYDSLPATRALAMLRGDERTELNAAEVRAVLGDQRIKGVRLAEEGGASPGMVAELAGFPSGEAMLRAIVDHPDRDAWVEIEANREMERLNPGLAQRTEELQRLLQGGLHRATQRRLEREWSGLPREAMQRAARGIVSARPIDRLNHRQALAQQRAAARAKASAAAAGQIKEAGDAARVELLNHMLHGELLKAQDEVAAGLELSAKLAKTSARERLGKASPAYREAVDYLRSAAFGGAPMGDPSALTKAVAQLNGDGVIIGDPDWLAPLQAALARVDSYQDMTVGEFRAVVAALKMLHAGANARTRMIVDGKTLDFDAVKAAVLEEIGGTLPSRGAVREKYQQTNLERLGGWFNSLDGFLLSPVDLVKDLTGDNSNSMLHRVFVNTLRRAQSLETDLLEQRIAPILKTLEEMPKAMRKRLGDPIDGAALFPTHRSDLSPPRKRFELLMLALNAGNEGNLQVLLEGRGITREQLQGALNQLTREEIAWANAVHASLEELREPAFELEERVTGLRPDAVEAVPMSLANGVLRGGYFPLKAVPELSRAGALQFGDDQLAAVQDPTFSRPTTRHGHLKSRTGATYAVSLDPDVLRKHLLQVAHDLAFREAVRDAAKLVMDQDVRGKLIEHLGAGKAEQFLRVLKDIGGANGLQSNAVEGVMRWLKGNLATSALSGLSTAIGNVATLPAAVATGVSAKHLAATVATISPTMRREALAKSGVLRTMSSRLVKDLQSATESWSRHPVLRGHDWLREGGMAAMRGIDTLVGTTVWTAAYRQSLASQPDEGAAIRFADDMLLRVLPSPSVLERAGILRHQGWAGALAMFYSYLSVAYRQQHRIAAPLFTREFQAKSAAGKSVAAGKVAGGLLAYYVAFQVLGELFMGRGPEAGDADDDDPESKLKKWRNWFARKVASAPLSTLPIVPFASLFESAVLGKPAPSPRSDPTSSALATINEAGKQLTSGDDPKKSRSAAFRAAGSITGVPTKLIDTTGGYLFDVATGEAQPRGAFDFASGVLYGQRPNQPENPLTLAEDLWTWVVGE